MTATAGHMEFAPPPVARVEWRRAWRAVRALIADPERTELAFEAITAISGRDFERLFQRVVADPAGRALLAERPCLLATLSDRPALRALPAGSFGRGYADFMDAADLDPQGLVEAQVVAEASLPRLALDPDRDWFGYRMRDVHDLWHVLSGYGRDEAGEAANLAFTYGQTPYRGVALILAAVALTQPYGGWLNWQRYLYRAWRRGRRAGDLVLAPYERLLPMPLAEVRRALRIQPAGEAHPEGVIVAPPRTPAQSSNASPARQATGVMTSGRTVLS